MAAPESLFGRDRELQLIGGLIDRIRDRGDRLVVSGEPGIGKSALLNAARMRATERGLRALRVTGVEPEARLAFAGLHQHRPRADASPGPEPKPGRPPG